MRKTILISMFFLMLFSYKATAQSNNLAIKFNTGMAFSAPKDDLGASYVKGKSLQLFGSLETSYHLSYSKKTKFGVKGAIVLGQDWANFLENGREKQIDVSVPNARLRLYPLSYSGDFFEGFDKITPDILPFMLEIPIWAVVYSSLNSLHFDYGMGAGNITESSFLDDENFPESSLKRTMQYAGWGLQPMIYQSESHKLTFNAVFDFGKYSWKNSGGGISSFSNNHVGFGVQYKF